MSLGRPTQGLVFESLIAEQGKGNSLTCFAKNAVFEWHENVPRVGTLSLSKRREVIFHMARCSYINPLIMMAVILLKKRKLRQESVKRSA